MNDLNSEKDEKKSVGRPTDYSEEIRDRICTRLAAGRTLRSVCRDNDIPDRQTIYNWITSNKGEMKDEQGNIVIEGFFDHYTRAREIGLDEIADETIEIADHSDADYIEEEQKSGKIVEKLNKEAVMRSRLRVDTRLRYLENMSPRKYGRNMTVNNQQLDDKGEPTNPHNANIDEYMKSIEQAIKSQKGSDDDTKPA